MIRIPTQNFVLLGAWALGSILFPAGAVRAAEALVEGPGTSVLSFGHCVADAGDVNGDGWPDFVVGAPFDNTKGAQAGRAFVWFGGPELRFAPDVVLDSGSAGDWFGWSVAGIGDFDDDGYDDVAVGGPGDDAPGDKQGAVWVYFGGPDFDGSQNQKFAGEQGGDRFGWSVSAAGDLDRDGIDDFVVGAPYADGPLVDSGHVHLFLGDDNTISTTAARIWQGPALAGPAPTAPTTDFVAFAPDDVSIAGPGFGWSVASVADFRGDGRSSVVVGAPGAAGAQGRAYIFFAGSSLNTLPLTTPSVTFTNNTADQQFGWSVSSGGRISNDARDDLLIAAPGALSDRGFVRVYYGVASPAATIDTANLERTGEVSGDRFGFAVAGIGDFDGNGGDWLVGAPARDDDGVDAGWVYRFDRTNGTAVDVRAVNRSGTGVAGDQWGFAVSGAGGDLDGDGFDDFLVGAPAANNTAGAVRGNVAIVSAGPGVVATPRVDLVVASREDGSFELFFASERLARATHAELWRVDGAALALATLDAGIEREAEGLRAVLPLDASIRRVQLRWTVDEIEQRQEFDVPSSRVSAVLHAPAPNPFNPRTVLRFEVPRGESYTLRVLDVRGRVVRELERGTGTGVLVESDFDGHDDEGRVLASGVYLVQLQSADRLQTVRAVMLK